MGPLPFSFPADAPEKKKERGPSPGGVGGGGNSCITLDLIISSLDQLIIGSKSFGMQEIYN